MKIYLAGPINSSGSLIKNINHFNKVAKALRVQGHEVYNPVEFNDVNREYSAYIRRAINILYDCDFDTLMLIGDWHTSKGVSIETMIADILGIKIERYEE